MPVGMADRIQELKDLESTARVACLLSILALMPLGCTQTTPPPESLNGLYDAMQDSDEVVRRLAYLHLAKIADRHQLPEKSPSDTGLRNVVLKDFMRDNPEHFELTIASLKAYTLLRYPDTHLTRLRELADGGELSQIRAAALEAIAAYPHLKAQDVIRLGLNFKEQPEVRLAAIRAAEAVKAKLGESILTPDELLDLVEDPDASVRSVAARISQRTSSEIGNSLRESLKGRLLKQDDPKICVALIEAFPRSGSRGRTPSVGELAASCHGLKGNEEIIWNASFERISDIRTMKPQEILSFLRDRKPVDPSVVLRILRKIPAVETDLSPFVDRKIGINLDVEEFLAAGSASTGNTAGPFGTFHVANYLSGSQDLDTRIEAVETISWSGRSADYLDVMLGIVEFVVDEIDVKGQLRSSALRCLQMVRTELYIEPLIDLMERPPESHVDFIRDALAETYWTTDEKNWPVALMNSGRMGHLIHTNQPTLQSRALAVWAANKDASRKHHKDVWRFAETLFAGANADRNDLNTARVVALRAIAKSEWPDPFIPELVKFIVSTESDRRGRARMAAIEVLNDSGVLHLYARDLIRILHRDKLRKTVKDKLLEVLGDHTLSLEDYLLFLDRIHHDDGLLTEDEYRFYALYFGGKSEDNKILLSMVYPLFSAKPSPPSHSELSILDKLFSIENVEPYMRNSIVIRLGRILQDMAENESWRCEYRDLMKKFSTELSDTRHESLSQQLDVLLHNVSDERCEREKNKERFKGLSLAVATALLLILFFRGFRTR